MSLWIRYFIILDESYDCEQLNILGTLKDTFPASEHCSLVMNIDILILMLKTSQIKSMEVLIIKLMRFIRTFY
jgi:hypothetical protein